MNKKNILALSFLILTLIAIAGITRSGSGTTATITKILVPSPPFSTQNVTKGTFTAGSHPTDSSFGTTLSDSSYDAVNSTGGNVDTLSGDVLNDPFYQWNVTLPVSNSINWIQILSTMNSSGIGESQHIALWNFSSSSYVDVNTTGGSTTLANLTFNITGENITWFVGSVNRTLYFLPHGTGLALASISIDYLETTINYQNQPPQWSSNMTNVTSPILYRANAGYQFNVTWTDYESVSKVLIEHNFTGTAANYTVSANNGNE